MVTVAFANSKLLVKNLISELFTRENISFGYKDDLEQSGFALLDLKSGCRYDVILTDSSQNSTSADYVTVIDTDICDFVLAKNKSMLVSYGLNSLATAIASSINKSEGFFSFQFCLQRSTADLKGHILEPQEFPVIIKNIKISISDALAYCTLALILGIPKEKISLI